MSQETYGWLAENVLAGFQNTRRPWWADLAASEGHAARLWDGPVPMEEVEKLLCGWNPRVSRMLNEDLVLDILRRADGASVTRDDLAAALVPSHKHVTADNDNGHIGVIGIDAATHRYNEWLTGTVKECVGDEAQVSSAGQLRNRAQAWVQIERPESSIGPDGIKFSPYVTLSTSLDGSAATQINQNTTMVVCDNTLSITREQGVSFKHTKNSNARLGDYRSVMTAIVQGETDFRETLERLLNDKVSTQRFGKFLDNLLPESEDDSPKRKGHVRRVKQDITTLYKTDPRVADWKGTAFGVVQAVNTYNTHKSRLVNRTGLALSDTDLRAMKQYEARALGRNFSDDRHTMKLLGVA